MEHNYINLGQKEPNEMETERGGAGSIHSDQWLDELHRRQGIRYTIFPKSDKNYKARRNHTQREFLFYFILFYFILFYFILFLFLLI